MIAKNCPDLLANFGDAGELGLESLQIWDQKKKKVQKRKKDEEKKVKKSKKSVSPSRSPLSAPKLPMSTFTAPCPVPRHPLTRSLPGSHPHLAHPVSLQPPYSLPPQFFPFPPMPQAFPPIPPLCPHPDPYHTQFNPSSQLSFLPFPPQLQQPSSSLPPPSSITPTEPRLCLSLTLHSSALSCLCPGSWLDITITVLGGG